MKAGKPLNVAVVGSRFMGLAHASAFRQVNRFFDLAYRPVLKAACARNPKARVDRRGPFVIKVLLAIGQPWTTMAIRN